MKPQTRPLKLIVKKALILIALIAGMCHLFGPTAHANGLIPAEIWLTFDYKTAQPARLEGIPYTGKDKTRTGMIVLAILSLPVTFGCTIFVLFATYFGHSNVSAAGLPPEVAILVSEIVAVMSEATLIYILSRKSRSLRQAGTMSLLMNAASFFFSLVIVGV